MNAGCDLELSYGMKQNVFTHIGEAVAKGNISLEVSHSIREKEQAKRKGKDKHLDVSLFRSVMRAVLGGKMCTHRPNVSYFWHS